MVSYIINSHECGRDENGVFHCVCGKCQKLNADICHDRDNSSNDCSDGGDYSDDSSNHETPKFRSCLRRRGFLKLIKLIDPGDVVPLLRFEKIF